MCGRFTVTEEARAIAEVFAASADAVEAAHRPRYNVAPSEVAPVVRVTGSGAERRVVPMRWGFAAGPARGSKMINARSETVASRPSFRGSFRRRRCLVPADGFYEWQATATGKQPYYIRPGPRGLFAMAGIWRPAGGALPGFAVLTRSAPGNLAWLHDRVPLILPREAWRRWLAGDTAEKGLRDLLAAAPAPELRWHPVSRAVSAVGRNDPSFVEEAAVPEAPSPPQLSLF